MYFYLRVTTISREFSHTQNRHEKIASSSDWSRFLFLDFLTLLVFFNTSLWTSLGALRLVVCNERVSNLFICSHSSVCDFFSVVHLHRSRLQLVGESEKKERMAHVDKIGFHSTSLSCVRDTQRQFSENDLRSRIFGTFVVKFLACLLLLGFSKI